MDFYCCYLLTSKNTKYKNHTYIGFTNDPARRIRQHNGEISNGAVRTSRKRPWVVVLFVYGFPTKVSGLQFEWAWQNPYKAKRTQEMVKTIKNVGNRYLLRAKIRHVFEMLHIAPWSRFPLGIHWITQEYQDLAYDCPTPLHHIISTSGPFETIPSFNSVDLIPQGDEHTTCNFCHKAITTIHEGFKCIHKECTFWGHVRCFADHFLESQPTRLLPTSGFCPLCKNTLIWGHLVRNINITC